jgi:hypothetical protein
MIARIQNFGELIHFHPHIHAIVTDGAFTHDGTFICLPKIGAERLRATWQAKVFDLFLAAEKIDQETMDQMRSWPHSGFSVDKSVCIPPHDTSGLERLAQYILRCRFSLVRVVRLTDGGSVIYRAEQDHCRRFSGQRRPARRAATQLPGLQCVGFSGQSDSTHSRQRRASGAVLRLVLPPAARYPGHRSRRCSSVNTSRELAGNSIVEWLDLRMVACSWERKWSSIQAKFNPSTPPFSTCLETQLPVIPL